MTLTIIRLILKKINDEDIFLERSIDKMTEKLPELKNFILPGGNILVSYVHLASVYVEELKDVLS